MRRRLSARPPLRRGAMWAGPRARARREGGGQCHARGALRCARTAGNNIRGKQHRSQADHPTVRLICKYDLKTLIYWTKWHQDMGDDGLPSNGCTFHINPTPVFYGSSGNHRRRTIAIGI
eukprot:5825789-Pleurochrysis_carterae.AAC.1